MRKSIHDPSPVLCIFDKKDASQHLIKDRVTTTEVHAVSVGPGRVEDVIKSALEMGSGLYFPFATYQRDGSQRYDFNQPKVIRLTLCPAGIPIANA